jgi:hypothetical protein
VPESLSATDVDTANYKKVRAAQLELQGLIANVTDLRESKSNERDKLVPSNVLSIKDFPTSIDQFTFVTPDISTHHLQLENGSLCPGATHLTIKFATLGMLFSANNNPLTHEDEHIVMFNMLSVDPTVYLFGTEAEFSNFEKGRNSMFGMPSKYRLKDGTVLAVYSPLMYPLPWNISNETIVILSKNTECNIASVPGRTHLAVECQHNNQKNTIAMKFDSFSRECGLDNFTKNHFSVVCPNPVKRPLGFPAFHIGKDVIYSYLTFDAFNINFRAGFTEKLKLIVFGDSVPFYDVNGGWDAELTAIGNMVQMLRHDQSALIMVSTLYKHNDTTDPLRALTDEINKTHEYSASSGAKRRVDFNAVFLHYSPVRKGGSSQQSICIKRGNISDGYTIEYYPTPVQVKTRTPIKASWNVRKIERAPIHLIDVFVRTVMSGDKELPEDVVVIHTFDVEPSILLIEYSLSSDLSPGTYKILFGVRIGENDLLPDFYHNSVTVVVDVNTGVVVPLATKTDSSGSSLLFRSGRQLDMMITV